MKKEELWTKYSKHWGEVALPTYYMDQKAFYKAIDKLNSSERSVQPMVRNASGVASYEREHINIIFDKTDDEINPKFVEVEDEYGCSFLAGEWRERNDGLVELRITKDAFNPEKTLTKK